MFMWLSRCRFLDKQFHKSINTYFITAPSPYINCTIHFIFISIEGVILYEKLGDTVTNNLAKALFKVIDYASKR